jgi:hypothetical protein
VVVGLLWPLSFRVGGSLPKEFFYITISGIPIEQLPHTTVTNFSPCAKAIKDLNKMLSFTGRLIIISNDRTGMTIRLLAQNHLQFFY